jgi:hypothetical protein
MFSRPGAFENDLLASMSCSARTSASSPEAPRRVANGHTRQSIVDRTAANSAVSGNLPSRSSRSPDFRRRPAIDLCEYGIEASQTSKAGEQRDFRHRPIGLVEQPFGALNAGGLGDLGWRGAEMLRELSGEMSRSDTHPSGEHFDGRTFAVKGAVIGDQACRAFHGGAAAAPCRTEGGGFGTASKTGAKSCGFGGGRAREETHIARMCGSNRADGPTIDARRSDAGKEAPVIGRVAGHSRPFAFCIVEHATLRWMRRAS